MAVAGLSSAQGAVPVPHNDVTIIVSLGISASALITGVLALFKGHGAYEHFKGTMEERSRQEAKRDEERTKKLEGLESKLDKVVEEVTESREIMRLVAQNMHLTHGRRDSDR
ncbi:MAG TPA: hypothetical protein PK788_12120 [Gemmatimonadaceae bacterium]|nr:hypothetical protein [Gemmatimonadaceae bacterium]